MSVGGPTPVYPRARGTTRRLKASVHGLEFSRSGNANGLCVVPGIYELGERNAVNGKEDSSLHALPQAGSGFAQNFAK